MVDAGSLTAMAAASYPAAGGRPRSRGALDALLALIGEELAVRPHRLRSTLRSSTIGALGAGLMAAAHVDSPLGPYLVWLLAGTPTAMMAWRTAVIWTVVNGAVLCAALVLARVLVQSPVLTLVTLGAFGAIATDLIGRYKLGSNGLIIEVLVLDTFYSMVFAPAQVGWSTAYTFGGVAISYGLIALADNWWWPDPAEAILLESLADWMSRIRRQLIESIGAYLALDPGKAGSLKVREESLTPYLELLARANAEGLSAYRRGVLVAALTRAARLKTRVDQLALAAQADEPHDARQLILAALDRAGAAIAAALDELAEDPVLLLRSGPDQPPPPAAARMTLELAALDREFEAQSPNLVRMSAAQRANLGDSLTAIRALGRLLERPLDESVTAAQAPTPAIAVRLQRDPGQVHYCFRVALSIVAGYVVGLTSHRPDLSTIMTTIIITSLPTYGAAARKMILRLVGAILGGLWIVGLIIVVSPNFETVPAYMTAIFVVLMVSGYVGQGSARIAYAGKQIGTTFLLAFAGLSPSVAVEAPLWRVWAIILGTVVVLIVSLSIWPAYAGDALPLRLRRLLELTIALAPQMAPDRPRILRLDVELNGILEETLAIAADARFEGGASSVDPSAVEHAAGTLRRMAHRFETITYDRLVNPHRRLDQRAEQLADAILDRVLDSLRNWLAWTKGSMREMPSPTPAETAAPDATHALAELTSRIEGDNFGQLVGWSLEERRGLFAELASLRRLVFLMGELDGYLSGICLK
jgi:hypothetical protein